MTSQRPLIGVTTYRKVPANMTMLTMVGVTESYTDAVRAAGGLPVLLPVGLDRESLLQMLERLDGVLLPGGGDVDPSRYGGDPAHPTIRGVDQRRDQLEIDLAQAAVERDKPLLAICRGHQVLNVALGGTLYEDVISQLPEVRKHDYFGPNVPRNHLPHAVKLDGDSKLRRALGRDSTPVNSLHHQAVRRVGDGLRVTAWAEDEVIEAVEMPQARFVVGVQWHPESFYRDDPAMLNLFRALVDAAA